MPFCDSHLMLCVYIPFLYSGRQEKALYCIVNEKCLMTLIWLTMSDKWDLIDIVDCRKLIDKTSKPMDSPIKGLKLLDSLK